MKYILILWLLGAMLGGCAIAPTSYGDREHGLDRDGDNYQYRDHNDGIFRNYSDGREYRSG
jgi:hypothetical protein